MSRIICDLIVDTHILSEIITSFDSREVFKPLDNKLIPERILDQVNKIIYNRGDYGYVVASPLAFVEIANKFEVIANGKFDLFRFEAFVNQPPTWFLIEPISFECVENLNTIDHYVVVNDKLEPLEVSDAIHVATVFTRDKYNALIGSKDIRIRALPVLKNKVLY